MRLHAFQGRIVELNKRSKSEFGTHSFTLEYMNREFIFYPRNLEAVIGNRRPAIVVVHGFGGSAQGSAKANRYAFENLSDSEDVLIVYPSGIASNWGLGDDGDRNNAPNDIIFFGVLFDLLVEQFNVDRERIYLVGLSRGAQALFYLAFHYSDQIAAIAPVCMQLPVELERQVRNCAPIPMALFTGTKDPLVKYYGGEIHFLWKPFGRVLSVEKTLRFWLERNNCGSEPVTVMRNFEDDGTYIVRRSWCEGTRKHVIHYELGNAGHRWPNGKPNFLLKLFFGKATREVDFVKEIWSFFRDIRKP